MNTVNGWRIPPLSIGPVAAQLAATEALWRGVAEGKLPPTLRWYSYDAPAAVLGVGQDRAVLDEAACRAAGVAIVKRASGGTVVLANERMLALDVALPASHPLAGSDVVEAYRWVGEAFAQVLRRLTPRSAARIAVVAAEQARADQAAQRAASPQSAAALRSLACFGVLSPYEVGLIASTPTLENCPTTSPPPSAPPLHGVERGPGGEVVLRSHRSTPAWKHASGSASQSGGPRIVKKLVGLSQIRKRGVVLFQAGLYTRFDGAALASLLALPDEMKAQLAAELERRVASLADVGLDERAVPELIDGFGQWRAV